MSDDILIFVVVAKSENGLHFVYSVSHFFKISQVN